MLVQHKAKTTIAYQVATFGFILMNTIMIGFGWFRSLIPNDYGLSMTWCILICLYCIGISLYMCGQFFGGCLFAEGKGYHQALGLLVFVPLGVIVLAMLPDEHKESGSFIRSPLLLTWLLIFYGFQITHFIYDKNLLSFYGLHFHSMGFKI